MRSVGLGGWRCWRSRSPQAHSFRIRERSFGVDTIPSSSIHLDACDEPAIRVSGQDEGEVQGLEGRRRSTAIPRAFSHPRPRPARNKLVAPAGLPDYVLVSSRSQHCTSARGRRRESPGMLLWRLLSPIARRRLESSSRSPSCQPQGPRSLPRPAQS